MINIKRVNKNNGNGGINLTPLIDIVFLLLIFFMLTANFIQNEGVKINVPKTKSSPAEVKNKNIVIYLTRDNKIYFKGKFLNRDELFTELKQDLSLNPDKVVILKSDKRALVENAVAILDIAKQAGAKKFVIATKKKQ